MRCSNRESNLLEQILDYLFGNPNRTRPKRVLTMPLQVRYSNGNSVIGENMTTIARVDENVSFTATLADKFGNALAIDAGAVPAWSVSDANLATIVPSTDGLSAVVTPVGGVGTVTVKATVASGTGSVEGSADVSLVAGLPTTVVLTATVNDPSATPAPAPAAAPAADTTAAPVADTTVAPVAADTPVDPNAAPVAPAQ